VQERFFSRAVILQPMRLLPGWFATDHATSFRGKNHGHRKPTIIIRNRRTRSAQWLPRCRLTVALATTLLAGCFPPCFHLELARPMAQSTIAQVDDGSLDPTMPWTILCGPASRRNRPFRAGRNRLSQSVARRAEIEMLFRDGFQYRIHSAFPAKSAGFAVGQCTPVPPNTAGLKLRNVCQKAFDSANRLLPME